MEYSSWMSAETNFMKLDPKTKNKLISSINKIHNAYIGIDILTRALAIQQVNDAVKEFKKSNAQNYTISTKIDGIDCKLSLAKQEEQIVLTVDPENVVLPVTSSLQKPSAIEKQRQEIALLKNQSFSIGENKKGVFIPAVTLQNENEENYTVGGPDKMSLYRSHLDHIKNIIKHLENSSNDSDINAMLFALPTGSGKTFIQALWLLILYDAGLSGVFSLPSQLTEQLKNDWKKVLPSEISFELLEEFQELEREAVIKKVGTDVRFLVASHEAVLNTHYQTFSNIKSEQVFLSCDEQHMVMEKEVEKKRFLKLTKKFLAMLLTATPDKETYEACGRNPVANMSNKRKEEMGQGNLPIFTTVYAKNHKDKLETLDSSPEKKQLAQDIGVADLFMGSLSSPIVTVLEELPYLSYQGKKQPRRPVDDKILVIMDDEAELINLNNFVRKQQNHQANDNTGKAKGGSQINVEYDSDSPISFYQGGIATGNKCSRAKFYQGRGQSTFLYPKLCYIFETTVKPEIGKSPLNELDENAVILCGDELYFYDVAKKTCNNRATEFFSKKRFKERVSISMYSKGNLEEISEDDLEVINGFLKWGEKIQLSINPKQNSSTIINNDPDIKLHKKYLEKQRNDFEKQNRNEPIVTDLQQQLKQNILHGLIDFYISDLTGLSILELNQIRDSAERFENLKKQVGLLSKRFAPNSYGKEYFYDKLLYNKDTNPSGIDVKGASEAAAILINIHQEAKSSSCLSLDKFVRNNSLDSELYSYFQNKTTGYLNYFCEQHLMLFMMNKINDGKPFSHFTETKKNIYNREGKLSDTAKKRKHSTEETLDRDAQEYFYEPESTKFSETIADNYFKHGFVGLYVSDRKTQGFNDINLATVILSGTENASPLNSPAATVQGSGRLRGHTVKQPVVIQACARKVNPCFDLNLLATENDYYPQYFTAIEQYQQKYMRVMSKKIVDEIVEWINQNKDINGRIDKNALNNAMFKAISVSLREINNLNGHNIKLTKNQAKQLFKQVNNDVNQYIEDLNHSYKVDSSVKLLGRILHVAQKAKLFFLDFKNRLKIAFLAFTTSHFKSKLENKDKLYVKVLNNTELTTFSEKEHLFGEIVISLDEIRTNARKKLESQKSDFLTNSARQQINDIFKKKILPGILLWVTPEYRDKVEKSCGQYNKWHMLLPVHEEDFKKLEKGFSNNRENQQESIERKQAVVNILKNVPGLAQLQFKDTVDIPEKIKNSKDTIKQKVINSTKETFEEKIPDFLKSIQLFFYEDDYKKILKIFEKVENCKELASILFDLIINHKNDPDVEKKVLTAFKNFLKSKDSELNDLKLLSERFESDRDGLGKMSELLNEILKKPHEHLSQKVHNEIDDIVKRNLAGVIVKFFNPNVQYKVYKALRQHKQWIKIFFKNKDEFNSIENSKMDKLQEIFLRILEDEKILESKFIQDNKRDLSKVMEDSSKKIEQYMHEDRIYETAKQNKIKAVYSAGKAIYNVGFNKAKSTFASVSKWMGLNKYLGYDAEPEAEKVDENVEQKDSITTNMAIDYFETLLSDQNFLSHLEPYFSYECYKTLSGKMVIKGNPGILSNKIFENNSIDHLQKSDPKEISKIFVSSFNHCFPKDKIETLDNTAKKGFVELNDKRESLEKSIDTNAILFEDDIDTINDAMRKHFLPFLTKWLAPGQAVTIGGLLNKYKNWPSLLKTYEKNFKEIQSLFKGGDTIDYLVGVENSLYDLFATILIEVTKGQIAFNKDQDMIHYFTELKKESHTIETTIRQVFTADKKIIAHGVKDLLTSLGTIFFRPEGKSFVPAEKKHSTEQNRGQKEEFVVNKSKSKQKATRDMQFLKEEIKKGTDFNDAVAEVVQFKLKKDEMDEVDLDYLTEVYQSVKNIDKDDDEQEIILSVEEIARQGVKELREFENNFNNLDKRKVQTLLNPILPIILNENFIGAVNYILGFLNTGDIKYLLTIEDTEAEEFEDFLRFLRHKNVTMLFNKFFDLEYVELKSEEDFKKIPIIRMFALIEKGFDEIKKYNQYYFTPKEQKDKESYTDSQESARPEIANTCSTNANSYTIGIMKSQGMVNALNASNQIKAMRNKGMTHAMEYVNSQLNSIAIQLGQKDVAKPFVGSEDRRRSYNFAKELSELADLTDEQIESKNCPQDSFQPLIKAVSDKATLSVLENYQNALRESLKNVEKNIIERIENDYGFKMTVDANKSCLIKEEGAGIFKISKAEYPTRVDTTKVNDDGVILGVKYIKIKEFDYYNDFLELLAITVDADRHPEQRLNDFRSHVQTIRNKNSVEQLSKNQSFFGGSTQSCQASQTREKPYYIPTIKVSS